jgi:hypothetical protein
MARPSYGIRQKTKPINDVEKRIAALMERLGSEAGTQNIDRIPRNGVSIPPLYLLH